MTDLPVSTEAASSLHKVINSVIKQLCQTYLNFMWISTPLIAIGCHSQFSTHHFLLASSPLPTHCHPIGKKRLLLWQWLVLLPCLFTAAPVISDDGKKHQHWAHLRSELLYKPVLRTASEEASHSSLAVAQAKPCQYTALCQHSCVYTGDFTKGAWMLKQTML